MSLSNSIVSTTTYECPVCDKPKGWYRVFDDGCAFACWSCKDDGLEKGDYACALAETLACSAPELIDDPERYLAPLATGTTSHDEEPEPLPVERVPEWHRALHEEGRLPAAARRYLREQRGLNRRTIERYRLGFDFGREGPAITIPVYADGELVNVRRRVLKPGADQKYKPLTGRGSQLYPEWPTSREVLLCEGEFDALIARQHGLPAVTSTASTNWKEEWYELVPGRRIAVVFDSGSLAAATTRAGLLNAAGAEAWPVELGLAHGDDLTDWFVKYGRSTDRLKRLIRKARP